MGQQFLFKSHPYNPWPEFLKLSVINFFLKDLDLFRYLFIVVNKLFIVVSKIFCIKGVFLLLNYDIN